MVQDRLQEGVPSRRRLVTDGCRHWFADPSCEGSWPLWPLCRASCRRSSTVSSRRAANSLACPPTIATRPTITGSQLPSAATVRDGVDMVVDNSDTSMSVTHRPGTLQTVNKPRLGVLEQIRISIFILELWVNNPQ